MRCTLPVASSRTFEVCIKPSSVMSIMSKTLKRWWCCKTLKNLNTDSSDPSSVQAPADSPALRQHGFGSPTENIEGDMDGSPTENIGRRVWMGPVPITTQMTTSTDVPAATGVGIFHLLANWGSTTSPTPTDSKPATRTEETSVGIFHLLATWGSTTSSMPTDSKPATRTEETSVGIFHLLASWGSTTSPMPTDSKRATRAEETSVGRPNLIRRGRRS
jgi:hypothetical protein